MIRTGLGTKRFDQKGSQEAVWAKSGVGHKWCGPNVVRKTKKTWENKSKKKYPSSFTQNKKIEKKTSTTKSKNWKNAKRKKIKSKYCSDKKFPKRKKNLLLSLILFMLFFEKNCFALFLFLICVMFWDVGQLKKNVVSRKKHFVSRKKFVYPQKKFLGSQNKHHLRGTLYPILYPKKKWHPFLFCHSARTM